MYRDREEILEGTVCGVIFQTAENGYTVLRLRCGDGETVTVVGTIPMSVVGERLMITGRWSTTRPTDASSRRSSWSDSCRRRSRKF